ncbi:MAG: ankyrin repeat domain-containing protein [Polyangiaceae bacterium]|nr:ankyrin repeat domain-containing protein [Polyangiaceae bacterium]
MSNALLEAIRSRDVDRLATLLAAGADPNEAGKSRYSGRDVPPLHAAIWELEGSGEDDPDGPEPPGPIDSVVLLLRYGAKVKGWDVDKEGDPLLIAVFNNHIEAVRLLLAAGADSNVCDDEGDSPLRICAEKGYLEMARLLLLCGATKTIHAGAGPTGMNALGFAATRLHVDMVRLLLAHGADPLIEDGDDMTTFRRLGLTVKFGRVPEDPAAQERLREIRKLLGEPFA